ncbi:putative transmembrane protein [Pseudozyma hubeiensis]|nr:putative transmembrane protein [Pseudozyma hubeiensis]
MADLKERQINSSFQGLVSTCVIFAVVGSISVITYESTRQLRRLPRTRFTKFWRKNAYRRHPPGGVQDTPAHTRDGDTCEDWEMGHFYLSRVFHASTPSPMLPRWPFAWVKRAISFTDEWYADHTGMDTVVYVRFLRACLWWVLLQALTTAPILLSIHITFSRGISTTDMQRASLSYLVNTPAPDCTNPNRAECPKVPNEKGISLLWIHLVLLWYLSITWVLALWWIGTGSLRVRKAQIAKTRDKVVQAKAEARSAPTNTATTANGASANLTTAHGLSSDNSDGWRQRTLMVMNLPATMRDEASIRRYFEEFLRPDDADSLSDDGHSYGGAHPSSRNQDAQHASGSDSDHRSPSGEHRATPPAIFSAHSDGPNGPEPDLHPDRHLKSPIQTVVLVRKMNELASMLSRRQEVLTQLEAAHVKLAQEVLVTVGRRTLKMRKEERLKAQEGSHPSKEHRSRSPSFFKRIFRSRRQSKQAQNTNDSNHGSATPSETLDPDIEKLGPSKHTAGKALEEELARRLARFSPTNRGMHAKQTQTIQANDSSNQNETGETVWEALNELPRELLDPFQPATRLSALFRGQTVPTIDYLLTKLNLLTALVTEMRSRPPTSYEPTSTAFVTFRDPRQARMVWRELKDQIVVKVRLAPEVKDLDWDRLMKTSFTVDVVRGFGVSVVTWGFTIFWVIIINAIVLGIFSVDKLKQIPGLGNFFDNNPKLTGFVTITLPPLLVSLASMSVPELIFQVSKRAQGFVTFSALYDMCLARYWKFVICNVVIFFSVGSAVIVAVLTKVGNTGPILSTVASAFPSAAPFFVSYLILQLGLQSGFEHMGFMIALLQHIGARKAATPRVRAIKTLPRNFNRYYWLPLHINIMAIVFIFALLNPLVIPFALVYLALALVIFKKNFAYHYYRRFNEMEGVVYFVRLLRYSLDAIVVMQAVLLIFFSVLKKQPVYIGMSAVLIPLTVITKIIATRLWRSQCRALDDEEAEALCGIDSRPLWQKMQRDDLGPSTAEEGSDSRSPLDALASGRYPSVVPPPPTESAFQRVWQRLHDSFNANGLDGQSYLATAHAKGKAPVGPVGAGARGIARTPRYIVKETAKHAFHFRHAAKNSLGMNVLVESPRASRDRPSTERRRPVSGLPPTSQLHLHSFRNSQDEPADVAAGAEHMDGEVPNDPATAPRSGKSTIRKAKGDHIVHRRRGSSRSEDRPFLSAFDAVSAHAPLPSEHDYDLSFEDGDAPFLEHDDQGHLLRQSSRQSRRAASRNYGTLRRKTSQLATVADEELPQSADSYASGGQAEGVTSSDPLYQRASHPTEPATVNAKQTWARSSQHSSYEDYDDSLKGRELVRPHPPVRWDDTPNNTARYNNPFYIQEMDDFLWLPRNPLAPVDLFDTIEWYGPALVSSQGGGGIVGEWDDEQDDGEFDTEDEEKHALHHDEIPFGGEAATLARSKTLMLEGDEEILLPDRLARHLEETQDAEQAVDPAASIPKNMMEDYKRALGRTNRAGSGASDSQASQTRSSLFRRGSNVSSPSAQNFAGGASLLQIPSHGSFRSSDGIQPPASPTQMRMSPRPGTGDSVPLPSVAEGNVVVPHRSSSRRKRSKGQADEGDEEVLEGADADRTTDLTPTKRRDANVMSVNRNVSRRTYRRDASGPMSRASGFSGGTTQKTVTLQAALRAEALEEERRLTLKQRLAASKGRKKRDASRDVSGSHLEGLEETNADGIDDGEDEEAGGTTTRRGASKSSIMARYEAQYRRREAQASEFGEMSTPRKDGEMRRDLSQGSQLADMSQGQLDRSASGASAFGRGRFRSAALGVLSLSRSPRVGGQDGTPVIFSSMPMQELRGSHHRPTTSGDSIQGSPSRPIATTNATEAQDEQQPPQQPQMVQTGVTQLAALPAEASRTSALDKSVEVPVDPAEGEPSK